MWIEGSKGRSTLRPKSLMPALQEALLRERRLHHGNLEAGSIRGGWWANRPAGEWPAPQILRKSASPMK
jgi:hypothetical protein